MRGEVWPEGDKGLIWAWVEGRGNMAPEVVASTEERGAPNEWDMLRCDVLEVWVIVVEEGEVVIQHDIDSEAENQTYSFGEGPWH